MQRTALFLLILLAVGSGTRAQDSIPPQIHAEELGDSLHFSAVLRPLRQLAGAPAAYYSYFWEWGDGRFSFDKEPLYAYHDTGLYQVRLYATNNYDDGNAPPTRPRPVRIKKPSKNNNTWASHFFGGDGGLEMKVNRNPKPGENFVVLLGYRNQLADSLAGSIVLFYNERQFRKEGFALADERLYDRQQPSDLNTLLAALDRGPDQAKRSPFSWSAAAEKDDPVNELTYTNQTRSLLHTLQNDFSRHTVLRFPTIGRHEEKFAFLEMSTLPEMIHDTNATVSMIAMMVPDDPMAAPQVYQLDLQVVSSHDPNRIQLLNHRINYRFMSDHKQLDYKINFQNTGKGPTRKIAVGVAIPPELDPQTIRIKGFSPVCRWCDSAYSGQSCVDTFRRGDSLYFEFNNIYLPGLQQGVVANPDSTTGYFEFTIRFKHRPKKIPFGTSASIVFDGNQPVITNKTTARFIKGISPGIMAGYNYLPANGSYSATGPVQIGYVLAPYSPYRPYFQAEASVVLLEQEHYMGAVINVNRDTTILGQLYVITGAQSLTVTKRNSLDLTPLHFRYNLNNWIGVGIGATAQIFLSEQTTTTSKIWFSAALLPAQVMTSESNQTGNTRWIGSWNAQPFIDLQVGRVRTGPVLGVRFYHPLEGNLPSCVYIYAGFKL